MKLRGEKKVLIKILNTLIFLLIFSPQDSLSIPPSIEASIQSSIESSNAFGSTSMDKTVSRIYIYSDLESSSDSMMTAWISVDDGSGRAFTSTSASPTPSLLSPTPTPTRATWLSSQTQSTPTTATTPMTAAGTTIVTPCQCNYNTASTNIGQEDIQRIQREITQVTSRW